MSGIDATLAERGRRYGASYAELAIVSQSLKDTMRAAKGWNRLAPDMRESLELFAVKMARILTGDPTYIDNWHDIIGYAKLVEDRLGREAGHAG